MKKQNTSNVEKEETLEPILGHVHTLPQLLFTIEEVAKILKISKELAYKLVKTGIIQGLKLGRLKVTKAELLRFLSCNQGKDLSDLDNIRNLYDNQAS